MVELITFARERKGIESICNSLFCGRENQCWK